MALFCPLSFCITKVTKCRQRVTNRLEIPLRHNTGDTPAVTCPSGTSQGTVPGIVACAFALFRILLRDGYSIPQKFDFVNSPQRGEFPAHQDDTRGVGHSDDATNSFEKFRKILHFSVFCQDKCRAVCYNGITIILLHIWDE